MPTPTAKLVNAYIDANIQRLAYLYSRWQDEKQFEDFNEYVDAVRKTLPKNFKFVNMTKRPFAVTFTTPTKMRVTVSLSATRIKWTALPITAAKVGV